MDSIISSSPEETRNIAADFARKLQHKDTVLLVGELGVGKTEFVKGIVDSLGGDSAMVSSPTFTLIHEYPVCGGVLYHVDLYRCDSEQSVASTGIEEILGRSLVVIEWPDRLGKIKPAHAWSIEIHMMKEGKRQLIISRY